jgi:hypothetical protein
VEAILGHAIFRTAAQTSDNHIVKMGMTPAAGGAIVKTIPGYTIFRTAVEAPDDHLIVCHFPFPLFYILSSFGGKKSICPRQSHYGHPVDVGLYSE